MLVFRSSILRFVSSLAPLLVLALVILPSQARAVMPQPAEISYGPGELRVTPGFSVAIEGQSDARVSAAIGRMLDHWQRRIGKPFVAKPAKASPEHATLVVICDRPGDAIPTLGEDESYTLDVAERQASLHAPTTTGALRGLATLEQLLTQGVGEFHLPVVHVKDRPRFAWRGLLIDVSRHWEPIEVIERNLDGMVLVKLNVLHLHLTDDQGFRIESRTHPELQEKGSDGKFFTQDQIRTIVAYAAARGIRVLPEFDIPGHATSWCVSHPELASAPGPYAIERKWGVFDPVLDPSQEKLYALLDDFLGEMATLFPDPFVHIGGDENNGVQWNASARIQNFIASHHLKDNAGLHAWFNRRVSVILRRHGKRLVGWDEILNRDLPADSVIQSWRGPAALAEAVRDGYSGLLSYGYYIDLNQPAAGHYLVDPLPGNTQLTVEQQRRVLGGEATMWGEWVTPDNIDTRIWPRMAAIAERFWSPRTVRDVADMYRRLGQVDVCLADAGLTQRDWPRFHIPGLDPKSREADALRELAAIVEPVKQYERMGLQPEVTQLTPLDDLADWSRPDSTEARVFNSAVRLWLRAKGDLDPQQAAALSDQLDAWRAAGELAAQVPAAKNRIAQARVQVAHQLTAISVVGMNAISALISGQPLTAEQKDAAHAALETAAKHTAAAVEFPILPALRRLVAAASDPAHRRETGHEP